MSYSERKYHEKGCTCGYLNPVTEWAGGGYVTIIAYECPQCKKRTPASEFLPNMLVHLNSRSLKK